MQRLAREEGWRGGVEEGWMRARSLAWTRAHAVSTRQPVLPCPTPDQALLVERGLSAEGCLERTDFVNHLLLAQPGAE